ncbi:MAG: hypothetical protein JO328_18040 [Hyphomicrobiales bacterium]|nr:hypothetical protein [Hyphomicrobiales bacterium]MBV8826405.1 hypothetical protein [Hyphomicrobiales bacterium]MBV9430025.1 hypothetical protein [Bradyrhizobiaceae bacterium]
MIGWYPQYNLSKEEKAVQATWLRRLAVVYGVALLLLVAFVAANRLLAVPAPGVARAAAPHVANATEGRTGQAH